MIIINFSSAFTKQNAAHHPLYCHVAWGLARESID